MARPISVTPNVPLPVYRTRAAEMHALPVDRQDSGRRREAHREWRGIAVVAACGLATLLPGSSRAQAPGVLAGLDSPEYQAVQETLQQGWNTWDSRSVLRQVHLPSAFALNLAFKQHYWLDEAYLPAALIGRSEEGAEQVRPGIHTYDGSFAELELSWEEVLVRVEAATEGSDRVVLVTPLELPRNRAKLVVEAGMLWNRPGVVRRAGEALEFAPRTPHSPEAAGGAIKVYTTAPHVEDPFVPALTPHLVHALGTEPIGISTGRERSLEEIRAVVHRARARAVEEASRRFGDLSEAALAVESGVAWNTIYEPRHERVVSTVGRLWNEEYGGYALFGWDNFFLAYMTALSSRDLALANVLEHLRGATEEGFVPNDNRGNDSKSFDRSQPPVGGIMVREVYRRYPERWFLEAAFDGLLEWNRWWPTARMNGGLLSYGSHPAPNPYLEPAVGTRRTAGYESGMDDSPMYEDVPFNPETHVLELKDVGLTSLYIADCRALAEMAQILGRTAEADELRARAERFTGALKGLWDESSGYFFNYRTDLDRPSHRRSPTLFYPLLAGVATPAQARRLVDDHLLNPEEFWGDWVLPSISRDDPSFPRQRYWKGAIWPPLNFLTYLGLRQAGETEAASLLADKSLALILGEWRRKGYVSENYSAITGTGDDERLSSDPFHSWGALFGIMAFIAQGYLEGP
jgi:hypothetical protein